VKTCEYLIHYGRLTAMAMFVQQFR